MPRKVFTAGEVLAAADVNTYLMNQAVMTFAGSAARSSAIGSATEGMVTYLADSDTFQFWNGTAYASLAPATPTLDYLVIGGGGSGGSLDGSEPGGGGGAGGYRNSVSGELSGGSAVAEGSLPFVKGTAYPITVGAGGAAGAATYGSGNVGNQSILGAVRSVGGGGGRTRFSSDIAAGGGSGGGGSMHSIARGPGIPGQGRDGGLGPLSNTISGAGGGGGAGVAGPIGPTTNNGTAGGAGLSSSITGSAVTRAGGGGGAGSSSGGAGGAGGGGAGVTANVNGNAGTVNTGSGGGGTTNRATGAGGSGVVIFAVAPTITVTFSGGVTQTNALINSKRVYTVTATSTTSETVTFS